VQLLQHTKCSDVWRFKGHIKTIVDDAVMDCLQSQRGCRALRVSGDDSRVKAGCLYSVVMRLLSQASYCLRMY
jgi:hypothetical protein